MKSLALLVLLLGAAVTATPTQPPILEKAPPNPVTVPTHAPTQSSVPSFTAEQAQHGQIAFYENCAECHGARLEGNFGPPLGDTQGNLQWESVSYVFSYMTASMPVGNAGGLRPAEYLDIMAFLLKVHGHASGAAPLTAAAAIDSKATLGP
ncbi:MAG TPA: c-type cytochrome [Verrucomicrobiae bacterium]|nr:c-type cytochrome [Verrucomicrobiae bacterium]